MRVLTLQLTHPSGFVHVKVYEFSKGPAVTVYDMFSDHVSDGMALVNIQTAKQMIKDDINFGFERI